MSYRAVYFSQKDLKRIYNGTIVSKTGVTRTMQTFEPPLHFRWKDFQEIRSKASLLKVKSSRMKIENLKMTVPVLFEEIHIENPERQNVSIKYSKSNDSVIETISFYNGKIDTILENKIQEKTVFEDVIDFWEKELKVVYKGNNAEYIKKILSKDPRLVWDEPLIRLKEDHRENLFLKEEIGGFYLYSYWGVLTKENLLKKEYNSKIIQYLKETHEVGS